MCANNNAVQLQEVSYGRDPLIRLGAQYELAQVNSRAQLQMKNRREYE